MDPIRPVTTLPSIGPIDAPRPIDRAAGIDSARKPLDPAVSVEIGADRAPEDRLADGKTDTRAESERRGFERDAQTRSLVYRVTDAASGDVIVQIPDEVVLKARAYTRQPNPPAGERLVKSA